VKSDLPAIRSGERADYKRCKKKWFWAWRMGLVPRAARFGALELGTWVHAALADWYQLGYRRNQMPLKDLFNAYASVAIGTAREIGAPDHVLEKADELAKLGEAMTAAYQQNYGKDPVIHVLGAEIPLEFTIPDESGVVAAIHKFKPDLIFSDSNHDVWLMEHKTAASIRTEHLVLDDQARPYGAMAERALRKLGIIKERHTFRGILYNFLRKALPDERDRNAEGLYLNKSNGTVSKNQPPPLFVRKPITMTVRQKVITLHRVRAETLEITREALRLRQHVKEAEFLQKTPHKSCPTTCQFFAMCVAEEEGTNIRSMIEMQYFRRNPYLYAEENPTADEPVGFEVR
jgi:hypothetical protein